MPRRPCCRKVRARPGAALFHPAGFLPGESGDGASGAGDTRVVMSLDEFEAIRLAHLEDLYQEQAAERMGVSRATFGRILDAAHRKLAEMLVHAHPLAIEGGVVREIEPRTRHCPHCDHAWETRGGKRTRSFPPGCPRCHEPGGTAGRNETTETNEGPASAPCPKRKARRGPARS